MSTQVETEAEQQANMAILARAEAGALKQHWAQWPNPPQYQLLRGPETGLVMVRGRAGGGGAPFNLGEATVTRATVQLEGGAVGHAYALGRDGDKVVCAALVNALWQQPENRAGLKALILEPLSRLQDEADGKRRGETAATRVNFFTMVRGED